MICQRYFLDFPKNIKTRSIKSGQNEVKIYSATGVTSDRVLVKNAYLIEFPTDGGVKDYFEMVTRSLEASHGIPPSAVKMRQQINSSLFVGLSIDITVDHPIEAVETIEGAIAIYPIYTIRVSSSIKKTRTVRAANDNDMYLINSHKLTGVDRVQQELNNYGKGVKVDISYPSAMQSTHFIVFYYFIEDTIFYRHIGNMKSKTFTSQ